MPAVVIVTERFVGLADATRCSHGAPEAPMILLPRSEHIEYAGPEAMAAAAEVAVRETVALLTEGTDA